MKTADIIKYAILSEKAYKLMERGIYTFMVAKRASKNQIADQIKNQFTVDVARVNIAKAPPKVKRIMRTRKTVKVGGGKKAIVQLAAGQTIALLSPKTKSTVKKVKSSPREKDVQVTSAEGKEG